MEHKLKLNIPLRKHYLNMNTNFKPFIFILGFFFFFPALVPFLKLVWEQTLFSGKPSVQSFGKVNNK